MITAVKLLRKHLETLFWCSALILLFWMPFGNTHSFCVFKQMGFTLCWGCGIGTAVHHALHAEWQLSWQQHFFGVPATIIIFSRIFQLIVKKKSHAFNLP